MNIVKWKLAAVLTSSLFFVACKSAEPDGELSDVNSNLVATDGVAPSPPGAPAPTISNFSASDAAITQGESTTLRWDVEGAKSVSIEPFPGVVHGTSVDVSPTESTSFSLVVSGSDSSVNATLDIAVLGSAGDWDVIEKPPALINARSIDVAKISPTYLPASGINCGGYIRKIALSDKEDAIVYMSGSEPLHYPLRITGGRNVRVVGLQIELATQAGCGIGELPNNPIAEHPNANIHPRIPGAIALRLQQSGTSFVEGLNIDIRGHQADCIVVRNPDTMSNYQAQKQRDVVVQNTVCRGIEGMGRTDIGDGIHGDLFQNQGEDVMHRLVFENVSARTSQEGITLHGSARESLSATAILLIRRFDYSWDPRYVGDDNYDDSFGVAFDGWPGPNWKLENIRIERVQIERATAARAKTPKERAIAQTGG